MKVRRFKDEGSRRRRKPTPEVLKDRERSRRGMERLLSQRRKVLNKYKLDLGGCEDCGYIAEPEILVFHHRCAAMKSFTVTACRMYRADFWAEVCKCSVLCPNCHALRHLREKRNFQEFT